MTTRHFFVLALLALLGSAFWDLMAGYQPDTALNRTADFYATNAPEQTGAQNVVAAIIVTYRGLDTLGEVTVLFLTAAIVGLVLAMSRPGKGTEGSGLRAAGELLTTGSRILAPLILLFGAYVFVNGHLTPGGGFQGGAILASAVLLLLLADPARRFGHLLINRVESVSGLSYLMIGLLGLAFAGGFLDTGFLPRGWFGSVFSGGAIPLIYILIGLKVGAEFSSMLESFGESEDSA